MHIKLPYDFTPRPYQHASNRAFFIEKKRFSIEILHRRAGKSKNALNFLVMAAMQKVGNYYHTFPELKQARGAIWNNIDKEGKRYIDHIPKALLKRPPNNSEMRAELINGSMIQLAGADRYDSLMGGNPAGIVLDEYSLQNPMAWHYLSPIITENGGWAKFIYTPRGMNHGWELYKRNLDNPAWFVQKLDITQTSNWDGTPIMTEEMVEERRREGMPEELIQQEFYCFPPDAKVMTINGHKDIGTIKSGDIVLTHTGRWRNVKETICRDYEGDVIKIMSAGTQEPIICTPDHPIRTYNRCTQTYSWVAAKDIKRGDNLVYPKLSNVCNFKPINSHLVKIIAWYITEGSCSKTGLQFTLNISEIEEADEIQTSLKALNIDSKIYLNKPGGSQNIVVCCTDLTDFLTANCGSLSRNKRIPFTIINGYEELFFNTMMKGDGHIFTDKRSKNQVSQYTTISENLAYQFQILGNSIGYKMTITKRCAKEESYILGRKVTIQDSYDIRGTKPKLNDKENTSLRRTKYGVSSVVKSVETIAYSGTVHNLSVSHDESYVVAGRTVHNCSFEVSLANAFYSREIDAMTKDGRLLDFPYFKGVPVHTAWDIGRRDPTSIWFFQYVNNRIYLINYYQSTFQGMPHYLDVVKKFMRENNLINGVNLAPHDIGVTDWVNGRSRIDEAAKQGFYFERVPKLDSRMDGINCVRSLFKHITMHKTNCEMGLNCLKQYVKGENEEPVHNFASHPADALRTLAEGWFNDYSSQAIREPFVGQIWRP